MTDIRTIRTRLEESLPQLRQRYPIKSLGIFGSYIRGEENEGSDLDILIEFDTPIGFFKYMTLEDELSKIAGIKVDLVMKSALKPKIGKVILEEVSYI